MDPVTPTATATARTANKLDLAQFILLSDWLRRPDIAPRVPHESDTKLAALATAELEFTVTPANLTSARLALKMEKAKPTPPRSLEDRLASVEATLTAHQTASPHLADALQAFKSRLNWLEAHTVEIFRIIYMSKDLAEVQTRCSAVVNEQKLWEHQAWPRRIAGGDLVAELPLELPTTPPAPTASPEIPAEIQPAAPLTQTH